MDLSGVGVSHVGVILARPDGLGIEMVVAVAVRTDSCTVFIDVACNPSRPPRNPRHPICTFVALHNAHTHSYTPHNLPTLLVFVLN